MQQARERWASAALLLVAAIWGGGFIATQVSIEDGMSPVFVIFSRFLLAALAMGLLCVKKLGHISKKEWQAGLLAGALLFAGFCLQTFGQKYSTPGNTAFLTATNVVMVPFFYWALTKNRPTNRTFVASFLCLAGVLVLSAQFDQGIRFSVGDLMTLGGAGLFALQIVVVGRFAADCDAQVLTFLQMLAAAGLGFVTFLLTDGDFTLFLHGRGMVGVAYLGLFSTCMAFLIQAWAQRYVASSKASLMLAMESLFGPLFSVLMGYDAFRWQLVVGGITIVFSAILLEWNVGSRAKGAQE